MFVCDYEDGQWKNRRITPMGTIPMHPACMALHYGQALFEGMKATLSATGTPLLFRPEKMQNVLILVPVVWGCLSFLKPSLYMP